MSPIWEDRRASLRTKSKGRVGQRGHATQVKSLVLLENFLPIECIGRRNDSSILHKSKPPRPEQQDLPQIIDQFEVPSFQVQCRLG